MRINKRDRGGRLWRGVMGGGTSIFSLGGKKTCSVDAGRGKKGEEGRAVDFDVGSWRR